MSNAYNIRLELLKMAQDTLATEYHTKCDIVRTNWSNAESIAMNNNSTTPPAPTLPSIYTMEDIVAKAKILNDFISNP